MNDAAKICGGTYQIVTENGEVVGGASVNNGSGRLYVSGIHRTLIVECPTKYAAFLPHFEH